ncbi:putative quinol monooxygenase [Kineococcus sp. SYSU DK003]|uniref:putative quinol monooxygenase n=1 Tax=Kineococcus sp. SYSU DK003 TaxID=3383124 RepID=UPI003D7EC9B9
MTVVIVHGGITVAADRVEEVDAQAVAFAQTCRGETGCREYQLSWLAGAPDRLRLLEVWDSQEAYAAHGTQPHVAEWTAFVSAAAVAAPAFTRLLVEEAGDAVPA